MSRVGTATVTVMVPVQIRAELVRKTGHGIEPGWYNECPFLGHLPGWKAVEVRVLIDKFALDWSVPQTATMLDVAEKISEGVGQAIEEIFKCPNPPR